MQGGPLSPLLCDLYLHALDETAGRLGQESRHKVLVLRYAADLLLLARDAKLASSAVSVLRAVLKGRKQRLKAVAGGGEWLGVRLQPRRLARPGETAFGCVVPEAKVASMVARLVEMTQPPSDKIDAAAFNLGKWIVSVNAQLRDWRQVYVFADNAPDVFRVLDAVAFERIGELLEVSAPGPALDLLSRRGVPTAWFTAGGTRCRGQLARTDAGTTLTRVRQHRAFARPEVRLEWAKTVVLGKIGSVVAAARHFQRHGSAHAGPLMARLGTFAAGVPQVASNAPLLGVEGSASAAWFEFFATLVRSPWSFPGRTRRPPTDPLNALLSIGYTWLLTRVTARAEARGYEIYLGGLHEYRAGRPSLSCDLIEPFRVPAVNRWVVLVCNQGT